MGTVGAPFMSRRQLVASRSVGSHRRDEGGDSRKSEHLPDEMAATLF